MKVERNGNNSCDITCPICKSFSNKIYEDFPSYVENMFYDIYICNNCETQFIIKKNTLNDLKKLYDVIYQTENLPGYERYKRYAKIIKKISKPLKFLSEQEFAYHAVYEYLNKTPIKPLKVLEIGSGLGYLTYALNKSNIETLGIDISKESTNYAKKQFGDHYLNGSIEDLITDKPKFDLIIATELIEHVIDPISFINNCLCLLNSHGTILLTTSNYFIKSQIWGTDLPPIHRFWFSKKSFDVMAKDFHLQLEFIDSSDFYPKNSNMLINTLLQMYFRYFRRNDTPLSIFSEDLTPLTKRSHTFYTFRAVARKMVLTFPIRNLSNQFFKLMGRAEPTSIAVILNKIH